MGFYARLCREYKHKHKHSSLDAFSIAACPWSVCWTRWRSKQQRLQGKLPSLPHQIKILQFGWEITLKLKMPGSQLIENIFYMFRSGTQTNKDTHAKIGVDRVKLTTSRLIYRCYWTSVRSVLGKYWSSSFFASLWTSPSARSINLQKKNETNISQYGLSKLVQ